MFGWQLCTQLWSEKREEDRIRGVSSGIIVSPPVLSKNKWLVVRQWRKNVYKVPQTERNLPDNFLHFQQALFKLKDEIWAISWIKFTPFPPPGPNPPTACIYPWGCEKLGAQAFPLCTQALCIKCIGSPTILLLEIMLKCRTWFIISIPCIRLRAFLSSCLKIFMSESICFTRSWNSLVSLPCCTLKDQKWGDSHKKKRVRQPPCSKPDRGSCG